MTKRTGAVVACLCAAAIVGCVSIEDTRAQLKSNDPAQVKLAEENILKVVSYQALSSDLPEKYVEIVESNELLGKIISCSQDPKTVAAAINKLDPSKPGTPNGLLVAMIEQSSDEGTCEALAKKLDFSKDGLSMEVLTEHPAIVRKVNGEDFVAKVFGNLKDHEVSQLLGGNESIYKWDLGDKKEIAARQILEVSSDPKILVRMIDGDLRYCVGDEVSAKAAEKLCANADKIRFDNEKIVKLLDSGNVKGAEQRRVLISKLSDDAAVAYALKVIDNHALWMWKRGNLQGLEDGIRVASTVKNSELVIKIASALLAKFDCYKKECKESWTRTWEEDDDGQAKELIKRFPKLEDATIEDLVCADETSWNYFLDKISENVSYDILTMGKSKSRELEIALVKKLPKEKIDMAVYNGVKYEDAKKSVMAAMSPELKKQAAEAAEKAYAAITEKAKNAARETFELNGFYLGMSFDDMKVVFAHHFPDWQIKEAIDGEGKDADFVIYIPGQKLPFCYADCGEKKVYKFNFGKTVLKKWYKYDVQNYMQWAAEYSREHKVDMQYKLIEDDTTVYDENNSYRVWFYQHSFQYKHNTKEYRLTYFGEEKDITVEGGLGGAIIKGQAASAFRYIRGEPGSLRVKVERD